MLAILFASGEVEKFQDLIDSQNVFLALVFSICDTSRIFANDWTTFVAGRAISVCGCSTEVAAQQQQNIPIFR